MPGSPRANPRSSGRRRLLHEHRAPGRLSKSSPAVPDPCRGGAQEYTLNDGKDSGVRADANSQCERHCQGKDRVATELSPAVAEVLPYCVPNSKAACVAALFANLFRAAEGDPRTSSRLVAAKAGFHQL